MKRAAEAEQPGESQSVAPPTENVEMQINGVVSGKRNVTCSAMVQRPALQFSLVDAAHAVGMSLMPAPMSKRPRVSFAGDEIEVVCDAQAPTMFTVQGGSQHRLELRRNDDARARY
jgi:hypothetical protein